MVLTDLPRRLPASAGRLAQMLATPLVPAAYVDLFAPLASPGTLRARIIEVRPETADAATLVLRPGRGWRRHVAGQWIRIGVDIDGIRHWRAYSLTSAPRTDGAVTITVKAIPDGVVSNHLVHRVRPGTVVELDQAAGEFVLPQRRPRQVLYVTGGSGITPVMGMLRHHLGELEDVVVVHSAPKREDVIFAAELRELAEVGRLRLIERHTDAHGILTTAELAGLVPDLASRETWACGPTAMLDDLETHWAAAGIAERLHTERFRAAVVVTGAGGTVHFTGSTISVDADAATPILDAGEAAGVLMPSGCRMGICFGCVVPLREGAVRDLRDGSLTVAADGDGVKIQTCINAAAGDCQIDL